MDVTSENFASLLPVIKQQIAGAAFIAIDEEMTGIQDRMVRISAEDTPAERYAKMVPVATKYAIIQFGISLFHRNAADTGYVTYTYNFYLFPNSGADLVLSASAITFLRNNGMDFGKWMTSGVSFADTRRMDWLQKRLGDCLAVKPSDQADDGKGMVLNKEADLAFAKRNIDGLEQFIGNDELSEYVFEDTNSYLRRFLYDTVERRYPSITMKKNAEGKLCGYKLDDVASREHKLAVEADAKAKFEADAGFRLVFDALVEAKKPLVGHNLLFDLLFMLRWLDGPLPQTFSELKERLHGMFPVIYDTKYLAASGVLGEALTRTSTTLGDVYKLFMSSENSPTEADIVTEAITTAEGFPAFLDPLADAASCQFHNAGYDAFCTGCVFAREAGTLDHRAANRECATNWRDSTNKKLFMMRSLYHMSLLPEDPDDIVKVKGLIYNVTGFARETKTEDIHAVFSRAFACETTDIDVVWVDDNAFFVVISHRATEKLCVDNGISEGEETALALYATRISEQTGLMYDKARAEVAAAEDVGVATSEARQWEVLPFAEYLAAKDNQWYVKLHASESGTSEGDDAGSNGSSSNDDDGLSDGEVAGVAIGAIAGAAILGVAGYFVYTTFVVGGTASKAPLLTNQL